MSPLDLLLIIFDNLSRRKARVALTAVGVIIGTAAVVVLVSLGIGLQQSANERLVGIGDLTQIQVMPNYGDQGMMMGPMGSGGGGGSAPPPNVTLITGQSLQDFAALPGVTAVIPRDYLMGGGTISTGKMETYASLIGVGGIKDLSELGLKAKEGSLQLGRGQVVVGALVNQGFYDPRPRPGQVPEPPELMGLTLKLTLMKWLPETSMEVRKSMPLTVVGVIAESRGEADYSIYMQIEDVQAFNEWFQGRRINRNRDGFSQVVVKVEDVNQVLDVADQIEAMNYMVYTPQTYIEGINSFYVILQVVFGGVGAIALLVAAIGIANTMAMAILERTREIGLMKAIGATNRDVLSIFLGEAAGIGFVGGLGGVILGWSAGQIINVLALVYMASQVAEQGGAPPSTAVVTPLWLPLFALFFATLIGLLSGLYPALRAATLIPVAALKYE